eukprot:g3733.t1
MHNIPSILLYCGLVSQILRPRNEASPDCYPYRLKTAIIESVNATTQAALEDSEEDTGAAVTEQVEGIRTMLNSGIIQDNVKPIVDGSETILKDLVNSVNTSPFCKRAAMDAQNSVMEEHTAKMQEHHDALLAKMQAANAGGSLDTNSLLEAIGSTISDLLDDNQQAITESLTASLSAKVNESITESVVAPQAAAAEETTRHREELLQVLGQIGATVDDLKAANLAATEANDSNSTQGGDENETESETGDIYVTKLDQIAADVTALATQVSMMMTNQLETTGDAELSWERLFNQTAALQNETQLIRTQTDVTYNMTELSESLNDQLGPMLFSNLSAMLVGPGDNWLSAGTAVASLPPGPFFISTVLAEYSNTTRTKISEQVTNLIGNLNQTVEKLDQISQTNDGLQNLEANIQSMATAVQSATTEIEEAGDKIFNMESLVKDKIGQELKETFEHMDTVGTSLENSVDAQAATMIAFKERIDQMVADMGEMRQKMLATSNATSTMLAGLTAQTSLDMEGHLKTLANEIKNRLQLLVTSTLAPLTYSVDQMLMTPKKRVVEDRHLVRDVDSGEDRWETTGMQVTTEERGERSTEIHEEMVNQVTTSELAKAVGRLAMLFPDGNNGSLPANFVDQQAGVDAQTNTTTAERLRMAFGESVKVSNAYDTVAKAYAEALQSDGALDMQLWPPYNFSTS